MTASLLRTGLIAAAAAAALVFMSSQAVVAQDNEPSLEYGVKAAYLYKFAPFVQWPEMPASTPFTICVMGPDPFGSILDKSVINQSISGRPVVVRRFPDATANDECNVAYITRPALKVLDAFEGKAVLTVTDEAESPEVRGVIHFVIRDNRVRFQIDENAAAAHKLQISSKLLKLAVPRADAGGPAP